MNKQKVVVVVVIVGLALVYLGGVSGLAFKSSDPSREEYEQKQKNDKKSGKKKSWKTRMGEWMGQFAPALDTKKLLANNKNKCVSELYQFKYRAIKLTKDKPKCIIKIPKFSDEDYRKGTLDLVKPSGVSITYKPNGESAGDPEKMTFGDSVSVVVMDKGGVLTLTCTRCDNAPVYVKFE